MKRVVVGMIAVIALGSVVFSWWGLREPPRDRGERMLKQVALLQRDLAVLDLQIYEARLELRRIERLR